jgi:hypothetical protein
VEGGSCYGNSMNETRENKTLPEVQLVGEDGNAYFIMGRWESAARKVGWTPDEIKAVLDDARSSDYNHLLRTIMDNSVQPEWEDEIEDDWDDD